MARSMEKPFDSAAAAIYPFRPMRSNFYRWRPHPWHGLDVGADAPEVVNAYLEITPFDSMKYEVDKQTGYLRIDRPQRGSSLPPCSYGFIPRTYAASRVAALSKGAKEGDGDPLDLCLISELPISRAEILVSARVLGGFCMIDDGAADDKIIAVLENDAIWGGARRLEDIPKGMVERIRHYFSTYKLDSANQAPVKIEATYGVRAARRIVRAAMDDYAEHFPRSEGG
jgi:inorganic pyrophosphatase